MATISECLLPTRSAQAKPSLPECPKIVRIIGRLNVGGPAQQVCYLHDRLQDRYRTVLITGQCERHESDMSYLLASRNNVYAIESMRRSVKARSDWIAFREIFRILKRERPDIVHTHTAKAGALGRIAAALLRVPVVVHTYHGHVFNSYFSPFKTKIFLHIERMLNKLTSGVIAVSGSQAKELVEDYSVVNSRKLRVVKLGLDLNKFQHAEGRHQFRARFGLHDDDFVVLWAGRLVPVKNVGLLAAIVRLATVHPRLQFVVAGDGPDRNKLEELTAGCGNIHMVGWLANMPEAWAGADLALLTSRNEGTPVALIEAMAACKPVVATDVGGVLDIAQPPFEKSGGFTRARNGFFTDQDAHTMLHCIEFVARDPALARAMGEHGRRFALDNYCAERLTQEISALYSDLLAQGRSRAFVRNQSS